MGRISPSASETHLQYDLAIHLSQLEKVDGIDSRSLVVSRAHSVMFAGLIMMSSVRRKESSDNYSDQAAVHSMSGRYWKAPMQL